MRHHVVYAAALCALWGGAAIAQKMTSPAELDTVMKKAGAFRQVDKAIQSKNAADARTQLQIVENAVEASRSFWVEHKREDALKLNKDALAKLDALEKVLSASTFDPAAATAAFKEAGGACRACHTIYRAEDASNAYILKPGSVPGISE